MPVGRLLNYKPDRGYGFISAHPDNVYVHATTLEAGGLYEPRKGDLIAFEIGTGIDGRTRAVAARQAEPDEAEAA